MNALVTQLKEAGQDHEFYPTTEEIVAVLVRDINDLRERDDIRYRHRRGIESVLDIGAGHGKVLRALRDRASFTQLFAIEKSPILCDRLDNDIFIVGTEFHEQSLVAKQADVTFCNPPYSEFEEWAAKIIRESASWFVYLVIPVRWASSIEIANALEFRDAKAEVIGTFSFQDAEDRAARANVNLIRIALARETDDAFDRFFDAQFTDLRAKWDAHQAASREGEPAREGESRRRNPKMDALVVGANYPDRLVGLYNEELEHIRKNYDMVKALDVDLLKEFDVSPVRIMGCLKARLAGLRNAYWQELFSHMKSVTNRLTTKKRRMMLETLNRSGHVDFTVGNIHAVVMWVMKNANSYVNAQLLETFDAMVGKANVRNYKSNERVFVFDRWRYNQEKPTHIALEYRVVLENVGGLRAKYTRGHELVESAADFIGDLLTVAHCMGFNCDTGDARLAWHGRHESWTPGERQEFSCRVDGDTEILFDVRAFQNGNLHVRLNQKFALALNVETGRLRGWVKSGHEAAEELGDKRAAKYFGVNVQLGAGSLPMLGAPAAETTSTEPELFPV
jgi:hypothetical protein